MSMPEKKQLTIRLPQSIFEYISSEAERGNLSINDFVVELAQEHRRRKEAAQALESIYEVRAQIKANYGVHPDSLEDLRDIRDGSR